MPTMSPPMPSATTAYWVLSASAATSRGSTRKAPPGATPIVCCVTSTPSLNRYHESVTDVAVADCTITGVVQTVGPPSVRVVVGMKVSGQGEEVEVHAPAGAELITSL